MRLVRPLDRYVFGEFARVFSVTALGFPLMLIVIDLTDKLSQYAARQVPMGDIALAYVFGLVDSMFQVLPAAVLFATVFCIGNLTRHSEITAAKASGISFYRLCAPIVVGAVLAGGLSAVLGEVAPVANARRFELLRSRLREDRTQRTNFAFAAEHGRVYKIMTLQAVDGWGELLEIERRGRGPDYPTYVLSAERADWSAASGWLLKRGRLHLLPGPGANLTIQFDSARDRQLSEKPVELLARGREPEEMRYEELGRFIRAVERSGGDANKERVKQALRISIPVTCVIIALFVAPLATSNQRGGAAYGIGLALGTTIIFLLMIQLTQAMGGKDLLPPLVAAWVPNVLFGLAGAVLLARVRT